MGLLDGSVNRFMKGEKTTLELLEKRCFFKLKS